MSGRPAVAGGVTPSFVNLSAYASSSTTTLSLTLPASIVAGKILIGITSIASSRAPTWPAGWTAIGAGFAAYRIADGSETGTVDVTQNSAVLQAGWIAQFSSGMVGATRDNQAQFGTTASVSAITTTKANSRCETLIVATSTPSTPSGYSSDTTATGTGAFLLVAGVTVTNSGDSSGAVSSLVANGIWRAVLIELKAP